MCIRSLGDRGNGRVYAAVCSIPCYTGLWNGTGAPEQDREREGSLLRGMSSQT